LDSGCAGGGSSVTPLVELADVTLGYQRHPAVHHLSGQVEAGSILAITGPNGAGKSTLIRALAGELAPLSGSLRVAPTVRRALLAQLAGFDQSFPIRTDDFIALGIERPLWSWPSASALRRRAAEALAQMGLAGLEDRPIATLSGGQLQRVRFARLLVGDANLILLDEPLAAMDDAGIALVTEILTRWRAEGRAVIAVLHEQDVMRRLADSVLLIAREKIAWAAPDQALTDENLKRARLMRQAWDDHAPVCASAQQAA